MIQSPTYALTIVQKEILAFDTQEYIGTNVNTLCAAIWMEESTQQAIVEKAVNLILEHEQGMRLQMGAQDREYFQYEQPYSWEPLESEYFDDMDREAIRKTLEERAKAVLPVFREKLYRFLYLKSTGSCCLAIFIHHVIADGGTMVLLCQRITDYCRRLSQGETIRPISHSYTTFVQKEALSYASARYKTDQEFWRGMYTQWEGLCRIKPSAPHSSVPIGGRAVLHLDKGLSKQIVSYCKEHRISPALVFVSGLIAYMFCANPGRKRIEIGQNLQNRVTAEEKETMGMFEAERMLCVAVSKKNSFFDLLQTTIQANRMAYYHGLCLHDELLSMVENRYPGTTAIREVEFSYLPNAEIWEKNIDAEWIENTLPETTIEFSVNNLYGVEEFYLYMDYRSDVFQQNEVEDILEWIATFLTKAIPNDELKIGEFGK